MSLSLDDDGREVTMNLSEELHLEIPETPTTGFRWRIERRPDSLTLEGETFHTADTAPGGSGIHAFVFRATAPGGGDLLLRLCARVPRAREADRQFRVRVHVAS